MSSFLEKTTFPNVQLLAMLLIWEVQTNKRGLENENEISMFGL